jgi:multiple sugar transport system permease protein
MVDVAFQPTSVPQRRTARKKTSLHNALKRKSSMAFLMTLPLIVLIAVMVIYPALYSIHLATLNKAMTKFIGFGNFEFLFKRQTFWMVVEQSCIFAITAVIFKALIGFIVAHFAHNIPSKKQRKWRGMLLVPWVIPPAMSTLAWLWLFDPTYSAFNYTLGLFGAGPIPWLGETAWARFSIILVNVWFGAPFFMIMYLAALKSVPEQLYEAAAIDGANWWQRIWFVTLPMMRNIIAITTLFSLIVTFANFDITRILTAGGPLDSPTSLRPGRSVSASRVAIFRSAPASRCSWRRSLRLRPSSSSVTSPSGAMKHEHACNRQGRPDPQGQIWQHEPRPHLGAALVLFLPDAVCDLLAGAAALYADHLLEEQRRDFGCDQSLVGVSSDAVELYRAADLQPIPALLLEFGVRRGNRGGADHADQRARGVCTVANEVLGFGDARNRRLPHLPDPRLAAIPAAVQDVRGDRQLDGDPAHQQMVRAAVSLPDADGAVLHLDHDRLFRLDPEGAG